LTGFERYPKAGKSNLAGLTFDVSSKPGLSVKSFYLSTETMVWCLRLLVTIITMWSPRT